MSETLRHPDGLIEEAEALLARATPGEWKVRTHPSLPSFVQARRLRPTDPYDIEVLGEDTALYPTRRGDVELVAAAPRLIREFIDLVRWLRANP